MVRINKKIMASAISGVLIASLIIVTIVMAPLSDLARFFSFHVSSVSEGTSPYLEPPLRINVSISPFEPNKLGGEANLTVTITHLYWDSPNTLAEIFQLGMWWGGPRGVILLSNSSLSWEGSLKANIPVVLNIRVKAYQIGNWTIEVAARSFYASNLWYGNMEDLRVSVYEDEVLSTYLGCPLAHSFGIARTETYIGNVTEPEGIGSEADLTVILNPSKDVLNATVQIGLPKGISLTGGNPTWSGNLTANVSISFKARIKFLTIGNWYVHVKGEGIVWVPTQVWDYDTGESFECFFPMPTLITGAISVHIFTDKIAVSDGWIIY